MLIDTHTHLYSDQFENDRREVIASAIDAGVEKLFLPNIDSSSIRGMEELVHSFPLNCYPMYGLHPGNVGETYKNELQLIKQALDSSTNAIAIGEIGMDLYWDKTFIEEQKIAFREQIEWAKTMELPIVIHCREAFTEIFEILDELNSPELTGVFHCFTGDYEQAKHILGYGGFKMGIGGVVTYKNSDLPDVLQKIDLNDIILETDSPYLPPVPHRGKRNESAYIRYVAEKVADVYQKPIEEIERITTKNAIELFRVTV